ncbi:MAG: serine hydrolase [Colwellia sp.]|nr:serine hydrolase [Colwellia sp.]
MINRINFIGFLILISLIGCGGSDEQPKTVITAPEEAFEYEVPEQTQDGWLTATLSDVSIDEKLIEDMMLSVSKARYGYIDSIVIAKDGYLVHEGYFGGSTRDTLNDIRSVSKSIISTIVGIAVDAGHIASVEDKVMTLFPEYDLLQNWHERKSDISIRHLLTMSSGLACNDTQLVSPGGESTMFESDDWLEHFLTLPSLREAGAEFAYCAGGVVGLAGVLEKSTHMKGIDFADEFLFKPLNINNYNWLKTNGDLLHPNGLFINSRDMAKIGQVMMTGKWNDQVILSQEWITQATSHQFTDADLDSLGFLWWRHSTFNFDLFYAHGKGGKTIVVIPKLNIVIAIAASNDPSTALGLNWKIISDFILPALM